MTLRKTFIGKELLVVGGILPLLWVPLAVHTEWFWQFNITFNRPCYAVELGKLWFSSGITMLSDWGSLVLLCSMLLFLGSLLVVPYKWSWQVVLGLFGSFFLAHAQVLVGIWVAFMFAFLKVVIFGF